MAIPSSGELKLWDTLWNQELGGTQGENSLHSASVYAGFSTPDALSDFYGWSDVEAPGVTTNGMSDVSYYRMFANGTVNCTGNENPDRGFYFGTNPSAATSNSKYSVGVGGTGAFSRNMDSQVGAYNTTYYGWAYGCNSGGETIGGRAQGTTPYPPYSPSTQPYTEFCAYISTQGQANGTFYNGYVNPYSNATTALQASAYSFPSNTNIQNSSGCLYPTDTTTVTYANTSGPWNWAQYSAYVTTIPYCVENPLPVFICPGFNYNCQDFRYCFSAKMTAQVGSYANDGRGILGYCNTVNPGYSDIRLKTNINYL